jgi:RNA methyltransferase, TrmH family
VESVYVGGEPERRADADELLGRALDAGARVFELAPGVLERVADTVTPQPLLAVVPIPAHDLAELERSTFVVVCADVRDPGNTGAVIRAADAAGADAVVCCRGTADPYNPKTVRASAGSVLHVPVVPAGEPGQVLAELGRHGLRRLGATAHGGVPYTDADLGAPLALVLGNEASGLPDTLAGEIDEQLTIEMGGKAQSLNVSLAAAVLCFEVRRQRSPNLRAVDGSG